MNSSYITVVIFIVSYLASNIILNKPISTFQPISLVISAICGAGYYYITMNNETIITSTQNTYFESVLPPMSTFESKKPST